MNARANEAINCQGRCAQGPTMIADWMYVQTHTQTHGCMCVCVYAKRTFVHTLRTRLTDSNYSRTNPSPIRHHCALSPLVLLLWITYKYKKQLRENNDEQKNKEWRKPRIMLSRVVDAMRSEAPMPPLCTLTTPTPLLFTGSGACSEQRQALNTNERSKVETTIKRSLCTQHTVVRHRRGALCCCLCYCYCYGHRWWWRSEFKLELRCTNTYTGTQAYIKHTLQLLLMCILISCPRWQRRHWHCRQRLRPRLRLLLLLAL